MTDLEKYKEATRRLQFLIGLWLLEDHGCSCSQCQEYLDDIDEILK